MILHSKKFALWIWKLIIFGLIMSFGLVILVRVSLPLLGEYRQEFAEIISQQLGQEVSIGDIHPEWKGYIPVLTLQDIHFKSQNKEGISLTLSEIYISMDILASWRNATFVPKRITISGLNFTLKRDENGLIMPFKLPSKTDPANQHNLFLPNTLYLEDSFIYIEQPNVDIPIRISQVNGKLISLEGRYQLRLNWKMAGGSAEFRADFHANEKDISQPTGELYLRAKQVNMGSLLRWQQHADVQLKKGLANFEMWAGWSLEGFSYLQGHIGLQKGLIVSQSSKTAKITLELARLETDFHWQQQDLGWQLNLTNLTAQRHSALAFSTDVILQRKHVEKTTITQLLIDELPLDEVAIMTRLVPAIPRHINHSVAQMNPRADLRNLAFTLTQHPDKSGWLSKGSIYQLHTQATDKIPGLKQVNIDFQFSEKQGFMQLQGAQTSLDFNGLFRNILKLDTLQGRLDWQQLDNGDWVLWSDQLNAKNADIATKTRFKFTIPSDNSIYLDLHTDFHEGDGSKLYRYLPAEIMPSAAVTWLDDSLKGGRVLKGYTAVQGLLEDFPFNESSSGSFVSEFTVNDLGLDYWPGWPPLEQVSADIRFENASFKAKVTKGVTHEGKIQVINASIADLIETSPLKIQGDIQGELSNFISLLKDSPLKEDFDSLAGRLVGEGQSTLNLNLSVPIDTDDPFELNGAINFLSSTLTLPEYAVTLNQLTGQLTFTDSGIKTHKLEAVVNGSPIALSLLSNKNTKGTQINLKGRLSVNALKKRLPDINLSRLSGSAYMAIDLKLPPLEQKNAPIDFTLSSNLKGLTVDLPDPLGKSASQKKSLYVQTVIGDKPIRLLNLKYGESLHSVVKLKQQNKGKLFPIKGEIRIGGGQAKLPDKPGLRIYGRLDQLDITPWLRQLNNSESDNFVDLRLIDVAVKELVWDEKILNDLKLLIRKAPAGWHMRLDSDLVRGTLIYPDNIQDDPAIVKIDYLVLNIDNDEDSPSSTKAASIDPRTLPKFEINVNELVLNERRFGQIEINTKKIKLGQEIIHLNMSSDLLVLTGKGRWSIEGDIQKTQLEINVNTPDLGELLVGLGFNKKIQNSEANFNGTLHWPDGIHQFKIDHLFGDLDVNISAGTIVGVDPGLGRLLGLLNISELQRRLSLDFSELGKGFVFNGIEGAFELRNGEAFTDNLTVEGPVARLDVYGRVGLVEGDLDQTVGVTAHVSSALPLAATIAGGPAVGAVVLLAQSIMGDEVDAIVKRVYGISGDWNAPIITRKTKQDMKAIIGKPNAKSWLGKPDSQQPDNPNQLVKSDNKKKKSKDSPLKRLIKQFKQAPSNQSDQEEIEDLFR